MKVIVVGVGSIGLRHIKSLTDFGHEVYGVDIDKTNLNKASSLTKKSFTSIDDALKIKPDLAFICTYSNNHVLSAIRCAQAGCHLFIEKPLSTSLEGIEELHDIVNKRNLISLVGCNMRFHPAISYVHNVLNTNPAFAKKLWANLEFGYYLPFAKKNYASSYMANRNKGGGLIFDVIHELDYAIWFFGEPDRVICTKDKLSNLNMDTEDNADMIVKFKSGTICTIHIDYLQHGYSRNCKIICENGTVTWDFSYGKIGVITAETPKWLWKDLKLQIYYNQMYLDEIQYFIDCVLNLKETFNPIKDSLRALRLGMAAEKSSEINAWVIV